ncbi:MAG: hypothetical protein DRQ51_04860 [Gammaproteobacteria bacterium]|nr:MAG: hypothetical protein DRQ51_04860 [Gammaproteobacteria bacterium]
MIDYETEEQQIDAIKKWWQENGKAVITGIVLGFSLIGGWQYYGIWQKQQSSLASSFYEKSYRGLTEKNHIAINENTKILKEDYSSSIYVSLSSLLEAKSFVIDKKYKEAQLSLEWVVKNANKDISLLARVRLARVLQQQKKFNEALKVLQIDHPLSFSTLFAETMGDIYKDIKQNKKAQESYIRALSSAKNPKVSEILNIKLDSVK